MSNSHESPTSTSSNSHESSTSTPSDPPSKASDSLVLQTSTMPINRSRGRNVHIYDAENPTVVLGGLILTNGVTNANLYFMLDKFITYKEPFIPDDEEHLRFHLLDENDNRIENNNHPLQPGNYYFISIGKGFTSTSHNYVTKL
jgi:hypothetical protein